MSIPADNDELKVDGARPLESPAGARPLTGRIPPVSTRPIGDGSRARPLGQRFGQPTAKPEDTVTASPAKSNESPVSQPKKPEETVSGESRSTESNPEQTGNTKENSLRRPTPRPLRPIIRDGVAPAAAMPRPIRPAAEVTQPPVRPIETQQPAKPAAAAQRPLVRPVVAKPAAEDAKPEQPATTSESQIVRPVEPRPIRPSMARPLSSEARRIELEKARAAARPLSSRFSDKPETNNIENANQEKIIPAQPVAAPVQRKEPEAVKVSNHSNSSGDNIVHAPPADISKKQDKTPSSDGDNIFSASVPEKEHEKTKESEEVVEPSEASQEDIAPKDTDDGDNAIFVAVPDAPEQKQEEPDDNNIFAAESEKDTVEDEVIPETPSMLNDEVSDGEETIFAADADKPEHHHDEIDWDDESIFDIFKEPQKAQDAAESGAIILEAPTAQEPAKTEEDNTIILGTEAPLKEEPTDTEDEDNTIFAAVPDEPQQSDETSDWDDDNIFSIEKEPDEPAKAEEPEPIILAAAPAEPVKAEESEPIILAAAPAEPAKAEEHEPIILAAAPAEPVKAEEPEPIILAAAPEAKSAAEQKKSEAQPAKTVTFNVARDKESEEINRKFKDMFGETNAVNDHAQTQKLYNDMFKQQSGAQQNQGARTYQQAAPVQPQAVKTAAQQPQVLKPVAGGKVIDGSKFSANMVDDKGNRIVNDRSALSDEAKKYNRVIYPKGEVVLKLEHLTKRYGKRVSVNDVNLEVKSGEIFGFLGPNGAGKTTTIRMITGLHRITEGEVYVCGHSIKKDFQKAVQNIGGIIENPEMYKYMTGWDNLKYYAGLYNGISDEQIMDVVRLVKMENRIHEKVKRYSLGMRQRIGIAQSLLHNPRLLILDEPTNGLDPAGIREMRDFLKMLAHEFGIAVFISSHILSEMQLMCDRVGIVNLGTVVAVKTMSEWMASDSAVVRLNVMVDNAQAGERIVKQYISPKVDRNGDLLILDVAKSDIKRVSQILVNNSVNILSFTQGEKTLEDTFLELTSVRGTQVY